MCNSRSDSQAMESGIGKGGGVNRWVERGVNCMYAKFEAEAAAHPAVDPRVELDHDVLSCALGKHLVATRRAEAPSK